MTLTWKRGIQGYAALLIVVAQKPSTAVELAAELGCWRNTIIRCMGLLYQAGIVHIGGWAQINTKGPAAAAWLLGPGPDVPNDSPGGRKPAKTGRRPTSEMAAFVALWRTLSEPTTQRDAAAETGMHPATVGKLLRMLHEHKLLHISDWDRTTHVPLPMYVRGHGKDAPRPKPESKFTIWRRYDQKRRRLRRQLRIQAAIAANAPRFTTTTNGNIAA